MRFRNFAVSTIMLIVILISGCTAEGLDQSINSSSNAETEELEDTGLTVLENFGDEDVLNVIFSDRNTDLEIRSGYEGEEGNLRLLIANVGENELSLKEDVDLEFNNVSYQGSKDDEIDFSEEDLESGSGCLGEYMSLEPGETTSEIDNLEEDTCDTGLGFPDAFDNPVELELSLKDSYKTWSYTCDPQSSDQGFC